MKTFRRKNFTTLEDLKLTANNQWEQAKSLPFNRELVIASIARLNTIDSKLCEANRYDLLG